MINEFKFGYNGAPSTENAETSAIMQGIAISLQGNVANAGIAGQGSSSSLAAPGGLVRVNSAGNGRGAPYNPYSLTFADSLSRFMGKHAVKIGTDVRMIRMSTDQLGGITYTFPNVTAFLADQPSQVQYFGDLSEPSPFHNGATGLKHIKQEYYVGFAQDEWRVRQNVTLNYGLRYDYYVPLQETDNRIVKFNIVTGALDPDTTVFYKSKKNNFQPRVSATYSVTPKTVREGRRRDLRRSRANGRSDSAGRGRTHQHDGHERSVERLPHRSGVHPRELHGQPEHSIVPASRLCRRLHAS